MSSLNPTTALILAGGGSSQRQRLFALRDRVTFIYGNWSNADMPLVGPDGVGAMASSDMIQGPSDRWATTQFEGSVYFTNPSTPVHQITSIPDVRRLGNQLVRSGLAATGPAAKYIDTFYDHLVLANVNYNGVFPNRVIWSDLRNFEVFEPVRHNEADLYDILEVESKGITGMGKLGKQLLLYTHSAITSLRYVGQPTLMEANTVEGIGNTFPYALIKTDYLHFFLSERWKCFFKFDGQSQPQPFGLEIVPQFFAELSTDLNLRYKVWSYYKPDSAELHWVYCSTASSGDFDREVIFQIDKNAWYFRNVENIHSFVPDNSYLLSSISSMAGTIQSLSGTQIGKLGTSVLNTPLWGTGDSKILSETGTGTNLTQQSGVLESQDIWIEPKSKPKEIVSMEVYGNCASTSSVQVYFSARDNPTSPITWSLLPQVWTPSIREGRLSFPRNAGRIFRFKFVPVTPVYDQVVVQGFVANVYGTEAEK